MKFGVCVPNYSSTLSPDGLRAVSLEAEKLGYDSIWTTDHILMPQRSGTPYERILESITALAYLAALTTKVKLGISCLITAMRNPMIVAKQLASLDVLSGGRLMLATSSGWCEREFEYLGSNFHDRGKRLDDSIMLIRSLWEGKPAFRGTAISQNYTNAVFEPKPVQGRLTIWIGGGSHAAMERTAKLGDGWHPNVYQLQLMKSRIAQFKAIPGCENKPICVRLVLSKQAKDSSFVNAIGERETALSLNASRDRPIMQELQQLGVSYVLLVPSPTGDTPVETQIRSLHYFADEFF